MKKLTPYLLVSPYLIHFALFVAFPVLFSIVLTFHNWNIISPMQYIGVSNYKRLFNDAVFWRSMFNTIFFLVIHIPLQIIVALTLAEVLNQNIKFKAFFRGAFFLPVIVSGVVVTILWQQLYGFDTG
ncbi:MAG: sugar ABC transporter permease, partial [Bacteroidetes bacterium]|nr:sugar ABC transporter permease [Bacteroidota bacterium]